VANHYLKRGAVWRIDFREKDDFRQKKKKLPGSSRVKNSLPRQELTYANYSKVVFLLYLKVRPSIKDALLIKRGLSPLAWR
jgi:hypothetical protein